METLIDVIKQAGNDAQMEQLIIPARDFLSAEEKRGTQEIGENQRLIANAARSVNRETRRIDRQIAQLTRLEKSLNDELQDALPIEVAGIQRDLAEVTSKIKEFQKGRTKAAEPLSQPKKAMERIEKQTAAQEQFLAQVLEQFPGAQVIDLQCLALLRGADGLPSMTLFSPKYSSSVLISHTGCGEHPPYVRNLFGRDLPSTPTIHNELCVGNLKGSEAVDSMFYNSGGYAPIELDKPLLTALGRIVQTATEISLTSRTRRIAMHAEFSEKFKVIPKSARTLIRTAEESGMFDHVLLVAEVAKWHLEYSTNLDSSSFRPKIEGAISQPPRTDDPLVVGTKKVGNKVLAVMVGAFNTTPVEHYARSEFCSRIKKK